MRAGARSGGNAMLGAKQRLGQRMADKILVVRGGTLIDGTGKQPVENAVIVSNPGASHQSAAPARSPFCPRRRLIDAAGKFVLPGYIDGHGHLEDFQGELYLHLGITSCATINIFQDGPWTHGAESAARHSRIRGPRIWMAGRALGGERSETNVEGMWDPRIERGNIVLRNPEDARRAVRRKQELGCDIIKLNEFLSPDLVRVVAEEAHALDLRSSRTAGTPSPRPSRGRFDRAYLGRRNSSILYAPARERLHEDRLAGKIDQEIACSYYEPENYGPIIDAMVEHGVALDADHRQMAAPAVA